MKNSFAWACAGVGLFAVLNAPQAAIAPPEPTADQGTTFDAWVGDQQTYDDNLYRLPSTSPAPTTLAPGATRADTFNTISLGGQGQVTAGRQLFKLEARTDYNRFINNVDLSNTSYDVAADWDWNIGSAFSGVAGAELSRALASFSEIRFFGKDLVKSNSYFVNGRYQLGPHWALIGNFNRSTFDHSAETLSYNNFRANLIMGGVEYATEVDDTVSFRYTYYEGRYPDNFALGAVDGVGGTFVDSDYIEHFPQMFIKYGITDKVLFNGNIGHLKRQYQTVDTGSYTGVIWRVRFDYQATEKVSVAARSWHEVHAYNVSAADYFVSTGGSVAPNWALTSKINLSTIFSYEKQHYIQNSVSDVIFGQRDDRIAAQQLNVQYTPRDRWIFNFFARHEKRNSSLATSPGIYPFTYGDDLVNASFTYKFF